MLAKNQAVQEAATEAATARLNQAGTLEAMKADAIAEMNAALDKALGPQKAARPDDEEDFGFDDDD